jgi:glucose/mannose-6-phosphate isomerase
MVATLAARMSTVPIQIVRGYTLPPIDEQTLVVASSYSGETEETLEAFQAALSGPGMHMAITGGGKLARLAESLDYAVLTYAFEGQPRAAIGWGVFPLLAILGRLGALQVDEAAVDAALVELTQAAADWGIDCPTRENAAKQIATGLRGRVPVILGPDFFEVAARRWAGQINENAKQWAFHAALPEADHNLIVGFGQPAIATEALHVLFLDSTLVHERSRLRVRLTGDALDTAGVTHDELLLGGADPPDALLRATYLGDWVSLYLGMLNEVDPTPVEPIQRLKAELGRHG